MGANGSEAAPVAVNNGAVPAEEGLTEVPVDNGSTTAEAPMNAATNVAPSDGAPAAAPVSTVAGLPEMGSKMAYVVEAGDTLGKIATKVYGDQKRWKDISDLTGLSNPNHIYPGDVVFYTLEDSSSQFAASYEGMPRGKETVQQGDTLASIAKRVYGSSRSWRHIWRQNDNIDNPDKLTAGMTVFYVVKESIKTSLNDAVKTAKSIQLTFKAPVKAKAFKQVKPSTVPEIAFI
jgi:nucleoid-associated protein YgaU